MKRLLIPFLALALCPPAQAYEFAHPYTGYKACFYKQLTNFVESEREWDSLNSERKITLRSAAHSRCK